MRHYRLRMGLVGLAVSGLSLATVGSSPAWASTKSAKSTARTTTKITVGILPVADAGGYYTAVKRGFFKKRHLDVVSATIAGGAALVPALESGAMQVGFSNLVSVLESGEHNFGMECLAGTLKKPPVGHNLSIVVSPKDASTIKSAKQLDGKTIAVNTLGNVLQLLAENWIATHGGTYKSVHFVAMTFPDMPAAIAKGTVDAAVVDEPFTTISIHGGAKILSARPYQVITKEPVFSCWLASKKWVNAHKAAARAFVAALKQSDRYIGKHPNYLRTILPTFTKIPAALAKTLTLPIISTQITTKILKKWERVALHFGMLTKRVNVNSLIAHLGK